MMTMEKQYELFSQLPKEIHDSYGFQPPFDYSKYECVHMDGFDYYPELHCIVMDGINAEWEVGKDDIQSVDINNPKHLNEIMDRIRARFLPDMYGIIREYKGRMNCQIRWGEPNHSDWPSILADGARLYYKPDEFDLANNQNMNLLARCLFVGKKYNQVQIVPYKDLPPNEWGGNCIL